MPGCPARVGEATDGAQVRSTVEELVQMSSVTLSATWRTVAESNPPRSSFSVVKRFSPRRYPFSAYQLSFHSQPRRLVGPAEHAEMLPYD